MRAVVVGARLSYSHGASRHHPHPTSHTHTHGTGSTNPESHAVDLSHQLADDDSHERIVTRRNVSPLNAGPDADSAGAGAYRYATEIQIDTGMSPRRLHADRAAPGHARRRECDAGAGAVSDERVSIAEVEKHVSTGPCSSAELRILLAVAKAALAVAHNVDVFENSDLGSFEKAILRRLRLTCERIRP